MSPNLFIAGVQKAATTSLYRALRTSRDITFTTPKETQIYLLPDYDPAKAPFDAFLPSHCNTRWICDASVCNFAASYVAPRINNDAGQDARFIVVLRNPFDRIRSAYWYMRARGLEGMPLMDALKEEDQRIDRAKNEGRDWWSTAYLTNSSYGRSYEGYLAHFSPDQFQFIDYKDVVQQPAETLSTLAKWLELSLDQDEAERELTARHNAAFRPRLEKFEAVRRRIFEQDNLLKRFAVKWVPQSARRSVSETVAKFSHAAVRLPPLEKAEANFMADRLCKDIEIFSDLRQKDYRYWVNELDVLHDH